MEIQEGKGQAREIQEGKGQANCQHSMVGVGGLPLTALVTKRQQLSIQLCVVTKPKDSLQVRGTNFASNAHVFHKWLL